MLMLQLMICQLLHSANVHASQNQPGNVRVALQVKYNVLAKSRKFFRSLEHLPIALRSGYKIVRSATRCRPPLQQRLLQPLRQWIAARLAVVGVASRY